MLNGETLSLRFNEECGVGLGFCDSRMTDGVAWRLQRAGYASLPELSLPFSGRDQRRAVDLPSFTFVKTPIPPVEYTSLPEISLAFSGRDQKRVVELPSLNSPQRKRRRSGGVGRICKIRIFVA